jgi:hypothetical protein
MAEIEIGIMSGRAELLQDMEASKVRLNPEHGDAALNARKLTGNSLKWTPG